MKTILYRLCFAALFLPFVSLDAAMNPAIVPADSRWLIYVDCNAARSSALGKELIAAVKKSQLDATEGKVALDMQKLLETVGTITAFGSNFSTDPKMIDGTLIAQGTPELRKIAEGALVQGTITTPDRFSEVTDLPFPVYAIRHGAKKDADSDILVAFPPEPIVIVSKSRAQLLKAREIFRGNGASLAKALGAPLTRFLQQPENTYAFVASVRPPDLVIKDDGPQARILKMTDAGSLAIGEVGDQTFANAQLIASSSASADKLMKILDGLTAMLSLAETSDKALKEFLDSTIVTREEDTVKLKLSYSTSRLAQMAQSLNGQPTGPRQQQPLVNGKSLAEWSTDDLAADNAGPDGIAWHTITNVKLVNGAMITLGRQNTKGRAARFTSVQIVPSTGEGTPLVFRTERMQMGGRNMSQFEFPAPDGQYTLKVGYVVPDVESKAKFAVSVREPRPIPAPANNSVR
jgi:hypothetical protein